MIQPLEDRFFIAVHATGQTTTAAVVRESDDIVLATATLTPTSSVFNFGRLTPQKPLTDFGPQDTIFRDLSVFLETHDVSSFRAFKGLDPQAVMLDAAQTWLMSHVVPDYSAPSLDQTEDDMFELRAQGRNLAPKAARSGSSGRASRPKSRKGSARNLYDTWI